MEFRNVLQGTFRILLYSNFERRKPMDKTLRAEAEKIIHAAIQADVLPKN